MAVAWLDRIGFGGHNSSLDFPQTCNNVTFFIMCLLYEFAIVINENSSFLTKDDDYDDDISLSTAARNKR